MQLLSRRSCLHRLGQAAATAAVAPLLRSRGEAAAEAGSEADRDTVVGVVREFMAAFKVPGLSVAIARDGRFVLQQGYGWADTAAGLPVAPAHRFRIASVSKPITSATIFACIEQGRLGLDDRVFGRNGRLGLDYGSDLPVRVEAITVRHLLTHTSGGWGNRKDDPMFGHAEFDHHELIAWTLRHRPLAQAPGEHYAYSNFGYCVLGRVIEKITGQAYAAAAAREVLAKCGVTRMSLAGDTRAERAPDEVVYYAGDRGNPYGMKVARMDAHGGWLASAEDLVRFAWGVDGFSATRNFLRPETIRVMTTPGPVHPQYACGWLVNQQGNWWHNGSLPGTATILVRTAGGWCWAALANTRTAGIGPALDRLIWKMVRALPAGRP